MLSGFQYNFRNGILVPDWGAWRGEVIIDILMIQQDQMILVQVEFSYDPPSPRCPTSRPLLRDPLDSKYTKVVKTVSKGSIF